MTLTTPHPTNVRKDRFGVWRDFAPPGVIPVPEGERAAHVEAVLAGPRANGVPEPQVPSVCRIVQFYDTGASAWLAAIITRVWPTVVPASPLLDLHVFAPPGWPDRKESKVVQHPPEFGDPPKVGRWRWPPRA